MVWGRTHRDQELMLRYQLATAALTPWVSAEFLRRYSGHWVTDSQSTQEWFFEIYRSCYGRDPDETEILT